jgi:dihydrofolate reductase
VREGFVNVGATLMGRNMFGGGPGPDEAWEGWWGDNPPFHTPVFVLTHYAREPLVMEGGTTFYFVTDGIESALARAKAAAGEADVRIGGGGDTVNQYLAAGLVDEIELHLVPTLLGKGRRLFAGLEHARPALDLVRVVSADNATHLKYRVINS